MQHHSLKLYDYHVWANNQVFSRLKELPEEVYEQEIQSVFSSVSKATAHIYLADVIWLSTMSGASYEETKTLVKKRAAEVNSIGLAEMEKEYANLTKEFHQFFESQEDLDAATSCEHPFLGRLDTQISDLIQHVVNHGTYHRGNITAMLRQMGYPGPSTDYVFYLMPEKTAMYPGNRK